MRKKGSRRKREKDRGKSKRRAGETVDVVGR